MFDLNYYTNPRRWSHASQYVGHSYKPPKNKTLQSEQSDLSVDSDQQQIWLRTAHPDSESDTMSCDQ